MAIRSFLAMTGAEFHACETLPEHVAWMACHFSPYGTGLTNLPPALPSDSLLILNDRIPISGHDPGRIAEQLHQTVESMNCCGVLLDFQHSGIMESADLAKHLISVLPCPVIVSDVYAKELSCPVFLAPCPHHVPLSEYIQPWNGRELWLDLAVNAESILLTKQPTIILPLPLGEIPDGGHNDALLHCHYSIDTSTDSVQFTLWRTSDNIASLSMEAEALGIQNTISLFLEMQKPPWNPSRAADEQKQRGIFN